MIFILNLRTFVLIFITPNISVITIFNITCKNSYTALNILYEIRELFY